MTDQNSRRRVEAICDAALDVAADEREAFVAQACAGDDVLRKDVDAMLAHAQRAEAFLNTPVGALTAQVIDDDLSGSCMGHYTLLSRLGSGGMGHVYCADDAQLGRRVAVKLLPGSFHSDSDRVARFRREAKVLAAMNHPNIAQIHGLEAVGGIPFLVLELVDGQTLEQRIERGPIPVDQTLHIARQLAEALEAAHDKGIIHRDLKPSNVALTSEGNVKVLDFGLAKAIEPSVAGELGNLTITSSATGGAADVMGTPGYMAPEQLRGMGDRRSDIWAFGCVWYEMLTGRPAFIDHDLPQTIVAVMSKTPDWDALPSTTPFLVRQLLRQCLEKTPRRRLQAIGDVRVQIEDLLDSEPDDAAAGEATAKRRSSALARGVRFAAASAALLAGVAAVAGWIWLDRRAPTPAKVAFDVLTEITPAPNQLSVSPDGSRLTAVITTPSGLSLWMRRLDDVRGQAIVTRTGGSYYAFWSADSRSLAFFADGKLNRIDVSGGPSQPLCDASPGRGGAWNRDGVILFAPSANGPLFRVPAAGGTPRQVTELDATRGDTGHLEPTFLPDGRHFIFLVHSATSERGKLYLGSLDSKETKPLVASDGMGLFAAPDHLLFFRDATLMAQRFDARRFELQGDPYPVAENVAVNPASGLAGVAVSDNGVLVYRMSDTTDRILRWVDRSGRTLSDVGTVDYRLNVAVAPRTDRLVETRLQGGASDLWILQRESSARFTFDAPHNDNAIWSPDGDQIVFSSTHGSDVRNLYRKNVSGAEPEELLLKTDRAKIPTDWSRDGEYLLYTEGPGPWQVWALPLRGARTPIPYLRASFDESGARFSPDRRWVAYSANEITSGGDTFRVYVEPFPAGGGKWQISATGGPACHPRWRSDGREIFYTNGTAIWAVDVTTTTAGSFSAGPPHKLFDATVLYAGSAVNTGYDVTPDGQRFLLIAQKPGSNNLSRPIRVVVNWTVP
jgi:serine/threonine protein kinase/Tol biopolymer transport system component